jgi:putative phosphoribosyl transferase
MIFKTSNLSGFFSNLKDGTAFQIRFKDRVGAGIALATALKFAVKRNKKKGEEKFLVLGIPRGGAIVADVVAQKMDAEFGVVMAKKLSAPDNKENAIGAVVQDGSVYLDDFLVKSLKISAEYIEKEKKDRLKEIEDRIAMYAPISSSTSSITTGPHPSHHLLIQSSVKDRIVILVDDGIASGATVIAAARWIRKQGPKQLTIAAPVAQPQIVDLLKKEADAIEILTTPPNFGSVNQFYQDFDAVSDERVMEILKKRSEKKT